MAFLYAILFLVLLALVQASEQIPMAEIYMVQTQKNFAGVRATHDPHDDSKFIVQDINDVIKQFNKSFDVWYGGYIGYKHLFGNFLNSWREAAPPTYTEILRWLQQKFIKKIGFESQIFENKLPKLPNRKEYHDFYQNFQFCSKIVISF